MSKSKQKTFDLYLVQLGLDTPTIVEYTDDSGITQTITPEHAGILGLTGIWRERLSAKPTDKIVLHYKKEDFHIIHSRNPTPSWIPKQFTVEEMFAISGVNCVLDEMTGNPVIHIMITSLCQRNCQFCCNKRYDLNDIPYVDDDELSRANTVCLTGGEPFLFSNPVAIAGHLKQQHPNIKNVYVYTNAIELALWLKTNHLDNIDGLSVSIKNRADRKAFSDDIVHNKEVQNLKSNRLYIFNGIYPQDGYVGNFDPIVRKWQKQFKPADNSIFRKL